MGADRPYAALQQNVRRCRVDQPVMLHAIAYGASTGFPTVPDNLMGMARAIFSSQVQSRINEKGNTVLRDAEQREYASHVAHAHTLETVSAYQILDAAPSKYKHPVPMNEMRCGAWPIQTGSDKR